MQIVFNFLLYPFIELIKLYQHGFSIMSKESKSLWAIAIIKLFIMFGILEFLRDVLQQPALLIGMVSFVGLLALRKPFY